MSVDFQAVSPAAAVVDWTSPGPAHAWSRRAFWSALAVVIGALAAARYMTGPFVVDDAYITFRYARNIAEGAGFRYNDAARVLGTTTPLYTLLLCGACALGVTLPAASLAFATLADAGTAVLVARSLAGAGRSAAGLLAATLLALWPMCLTYAVSGLETSLYTFLLLLCLVLAPASSNSWLGVVSGLLVLCRPDGAIAAALAVGVRWRQSGRRAAMRTVAVAGIVVLPWLIFSTAYFGSFVPQSVLAKATLSRPPLIGWRTLLSFFWEGKYVGLTVLALAGWAVLGLGRRHVALWLVGAWTAFYAVLFAATGAFSDFPWYFVPMLPAYFAGMATAVTWLADAGSGMLGRLAPARPVSRLVTLAGAVVCAAAIVVGLLNVRHHREFLERLSRGREAAYSRVAVQLSREDGRAVLAATEIGTLGYFYRGPVVDLVGLVSPEAVGRPPLDVLTETHARWLVTYDTHFPRDVASSGAFLRQYERVGHTAVGAGRSLDVYRSRTAPVTPAITR